MPVNIVTLPLPTSSPFLQMRHCIETQINGSVESSKAPVGKEWYWRISKGYSRLSVCERFMVQSSSVVERSSWKKPSITLSRYSSVNSAGFTLCAWWWRRRQRLFKRSEIIARTRQKMINGIFLHMKRDEACKWRRGKSIKYQCQSMIHARYHQGNLISSLVEQSLH